MTRPIGAAALLVGLAGCLGNELDGPSIRNKPVETPKLPKASVQTALRVDQVGRQLVSQSLFLGVEPTFSTYGQKEPEIFHPNLSSVFVTEGLVSKCKTDDELAAVLAVELATMSAESRAANRMRGAGPMPTLPDAATVSAGGIASDQNQLGTQAIIDRRLGPTKRPGRPAANDTRAAAADILRSAGFDPKALDQVTPLMQEAGSHHAAAEGLGERPTRPRWSN